MTEDTRTLKISSTAQAPREHGGNLDAAMQRHGGVRAEWIDLSTGINPHAYPIPVLEPDLWQALPRQSDMRALLDAAADAYHTSAPILAFAGAQGVIQAVPYLRSAGTARILSPTYNEHAGALRDAGWTVNEVNAPEALHGADLAVLVNPNNPDGRRIPPDQVLELADHVGLLVVDESFVDAEPDLSVAPQLTARSDRVLVMRSFGKFYGLAGLRLGFAVTGADLASDLSRMAGPWPVSGPAMAIAQAALADRVWQRDTVTRLRRDAAQLDRLTEAAGWTLVGGTPLFRTYAMPGSASDAARMQDRLARHRIWVRVFSYAPGWIRLGLPATEAEFARIADALRP